MKCKKVISWITMIAIVITLLAGTTLSASASSCRIFIKDAVVQAGEKVVVDVELVAEDIASLKFDIKYDKSILTLTEIEYTREFFEAFGSLNEVNLNADPYPIVTWVRAMNYSFDGVAFQLTFEAKSNVHGPVDVGFNYTESYFTTGNEKTYRVNLQASGGTVYVKDQDWTNYDAALETLYAVLNESSKYTYNSYVAFWEKLNYFVPLRNSDYTIPQSTINAKTKEMNDMLGLLAERIPAKGMTLNKTTSKIQVGSTDQLNVTFTPGNATDSVKWTSSDTKVATVDSNGLVRAVSVGSATITATNQDDTAMKATCKVECAIPLSAITMRVDPFTLDYGQSKDLSKSVVYYPADATNKTIIWSSSNSSIATVDAKGVVRPVKNGTVTIRGVSQDGGYEVSCTVTVNITYVPVSSVTLQSTAKAAVKGTVTLKPTVLPAGATNKKVTWKSSNAAIATVNANGVVTGVKTGKATITVTTEDGKKTDTCVVTVGTPVTGITLPSGTTNVTLGSTTQLKYTVSPSNATEKPTFSSSNTSIATIDKNGKITPKKAGTVTITVKTGSVTKTCKITIHNYVSLRIGYTKAIHNGTKTTVDNVGTKPFKISGKTMIPLRFVGSRMGGKVKYVNDKTPITLTYNGIKVEFKLNSKAMKVIDAKGNTKTVTLDVAAQKKSGKTYIPLRAIGAALGFTVYYQSSTEIIIVNNPKMSTTLRGTRLSEANAYIK